MLVDLVLAVRHLRHLSDDLGQRHGPAPLGVRRSDGGLERRREFVIITTAIYLLARRVLARLSRRAFRFGLGVYFGDSGSELNGIVIVRVAVCTHGFVFLASASLPAAAEPAWGRLGMPRGDARWRRRSVPTQ